MWQDQSKSPVSGVAVALFAISVAAGLGLATALENRAPFVGGLLVGVYLLFSIKVADQWERVAVLRLGRYIGLRGPGLFHMIPSRRHAQPVCRPEGSCGQRDGGIHSHPRHRACECGRHRVLAGLERGEVAFWKLRTSFRQSP